MGRITSAADPLNHYTCYAAYLSTAGVLPQTFSRNSWKHVVYHESSPFIAVINTRQTLFCQETYGFVLSSVLRATLITAQRNFLEILSYELFVRLFFGSGGPAQ